MSITLWQYYLNLSARIAEDALKDVRSLSDWQSRREEIYRQFMRSMGLEPLPPKCDLNIRRYGEFSGKGYRATKMAFQVMPNCWGTGCLYLPDPLPRTKLPAVLYACGHHFIGVHGYQDHAAMWARRGYACFVFDTIEQHDNPGEHHGLYYGTRYDWLSMGYTGAGGELWNSIRALDLLASQPEVDPTRIGTTGNSGGGALSFFIAIADPRIRAVATSCGVATPKYTLADRHLLGHCDCIYFHNIYQRDTSEFAALIAPRPALFCFATQDSLFTPEEYRTMVERARKIYRLHGCEERCQLFEYPGPHGYKPESVAAINAWFDQHVAGEPHPPLQREPYEHPEKIVTIFNGAPPVPDHLDLLPELLSRRGSVPLPQDADEWQRIRESARGVLRREVFHLFQQMDEPLAAKEVSSWLSGNLTVKAYRGCIGGMEIWIDAVIRPEDSGKVLIGLADRDTNSHDLLRELGEYSPRWSVVAIEPRGTGFSAYNQAQERHLLRAGALTGLTPAMLLLRDLGLILDFLRAESFVKDRQVWLFGRGDAGVACVYQAVLDDAISGVVAVNLPASHRQGAYILGILRVMDLDQAVGLVAPRPIGIVNRAQGGFFNWPRRVYERLGCPERLVMNRHSVRAAIEGVMEASALRK